MAGLLRPAGCPFFSCAEIKWECSKTLAQQYESYPRKGSTVLDILCVHELLSYVADLLRRTFATEQEQSERRRKITRHPCGATRSRNGLAAVLVRIFFLLDVVYCGPLRGTTEATA